LAKLVDFIDAKVPKSESDERILNRKYKDINQEESVKYAYSKSLESIGNINNLDVCFSPKHSSNDQSTNKNVILEKFSLDNFKKDELNEKETNDSLLDSYLSKNKISTYNPQSLSFKNTTFTIFKHLKDKKSGLVDFFASNESKALTNLFVSDAESKPIDKAHSEVLYIY
jgi:hypothetical protein